MELMKEDGECTCRWKYMNYSKCTKRQIALSVTSWDMPKEMKIIHGKGKEKTRSESGKKIRPNN